MNQKEIEIVDKNLINDPKCYNMKVSGIGGFTSENAAKGGKTAYEKGSHHWKTNHPGGNFKKGDLKTVEAAKKSWENRKDKPRPPMKEEQKEKIRQTLLGRKKEKPERKPRTLFKIQEPSGRIIQTNNLKYYLIENKLGRLTDEKLARKGYIILERLNIKDLDINVPGEPFIIFENFWTK